MKSSMVFPTSLRHFSFVNNDKSEVWSVVQDTSTLFNKFFDHWKNEELTIGYIPIEEFDDLVGCDLLLSNSYGFNLGDDLFDIISFEIYNGPDTTARTLIDHLNEWSEWTNGVRLFYGYQLQWRSGVLINIEPCSVLGFYIDDIMFKYRMQIKDANDFQL